MNTLTNKLNIFSLSAILFIMFLTLFTVPGTKASAYDFGYYDGYYDSGYYDSGYGSYDNYYDSGYFDSGYGSYDNYYDSGYYDSGYGSYDGYYDSGYYDSYYGSSNYYGGYDDYCYDCYYDDYCYDCYDDDYCYDCYTPPPCTTCNEPPPVVVPSISLSCVPSRSYGETGDSITWSTIVSGGNGSYTYSWSGTDGLSGSSGSVTKTYNSEGSKTANVTVTSGGKTASAYCGTIFIEEDEESLTGSCEVSDSRVEVDETVRWTAEASGGTGSYTYEWSGSYPLSGENGKRVDVEYETSGTKYGSVTIRSGNKSITRSCETVRVEEEDEDEDYRSLNLSCSVNNSNLTLGQSATWYASASGGNGNYRYSWSGTDNMYGSNSSITKNYNTVGTKNASVTVTSDGRSRTVDCPVAVVGTVGFQNPNQGNLAALSSVYLNQVPYTGIEDNPKLLFFIVSLIMLSGFGAYAIIFNQAKTQRKNKILSFKHENMLRKGIK